MSELRIGHGYDVHKLVEGRRLIIGGVDIPHKLGLLGHSDADVLLHAIMDALLGALGLGDIGMHFPDNSEEFLDISSINLLVRVKKILDENSAKVVNIDSIIEKNSKNAEKKVVDSIRVKGNRPVENGSEGNSGILLSGNASKLTKKQRADLAKRAAKGEKISF